MIKSIKPWIVSFRLRTLPLSVSCIIIGSFLAGSSGKFDIAVFLLAVTTTLLLQILSNISNEYGDMLKGTDSDGRIGPARSIQRGEITLPQMKVMIIIISIAASISGASLVIYSTLSYYTLLFLIAGIFAIAAAIKYTVGKKPFGYKALGDLFVFIFFGPVGVIGTFFLHTGLFRYDIILPSITAGLLSVAVLNLNNMRDIENDLKHGKITVASLLGKKYSRIYHFLLILISIISSLIFSRINFFSTVKYIYAISFILLIVDLKVIFTYKNSAELDPELKRVAVSNFLHSIMLGIALII
jgi:1,4-dihydroxy-2-naphthoate polyprenyltransferase